MHTIKNWNYLNINKILKIKNQIKKNLCSFLS